MRPTLVVVAYNRPAALRRLLSSLTRMAATDPTPHLVISVDWGGSRQAEVLDIAERCAWPGPKTVIARSERLGLKEHVLRCGDLTETFGSIVMLEDDLVVSPFLLEFAEPALARYRGDNRIAGISLFNYEFNETAKLPFSAIRQDRDTYFVQLPSSWGQAWTFDQWRSFRSWLEGHAEWQPCSGLPRDVLRWPATSWKRDFCRYLLETDRFFVYPYHSYTANCGDPGTHMADECNHFKSSLMMGRTEISFADLDDEAVVYDAHLEMLPSILKRWNPELRPFDFAVDLNGAKNLQGIKQEFILTVKNCRHPECSFGLELQPAELNVLLGIEGAGIHLGRTQHVEDVQPYTKLHAFYSRMPPPPLPSLRSQIEGRLSSNESPLSRVSLTALRALLWFVDVARNLRRGLLTTPEEHRPIGDPKGECRGPLS